MQLYILIGWHATVCATNGLTCNCIYMILMDMQRYMLLMGRHATAYATNGLTCNCICYQWVDMQLYMLLMGWHATEYGTNENPGWHNGTTGRYQ